MHIITQRKLKDVLKSLIYTRRRMNSLMKSLFSRLDSENDKVVGLEHNLTHETFCNLLLSNVLSNVETLSAATVEALLGFFCFFGRREMGGKLPRKKKK